MEWIDILIVLGSLVLLYLLIYIIVRSINGTSVLTSNVNVNGGKLTADQVYHLPGYRLSIVAKVKIRVKKINGVIGGGPELVELTLIPQTITEADTEQLISLQFNNDIFSNDEIRIGVSAGSLLENVQVVIDDRIDEIVTAIAAAPEDIVNTLQARGVVRAGVTTFEEREFSRVFETSEQETGSFGAIRRTWIIPVEGEEVDASFTLTNLSHKPRLVLTGNTQYEGILTRPLVRQHWEMELISTGTRAIAFSCMVPDHSRLICIPVRRGWFIQKMQMPKFSNGMLVENYIKKPSEAEAFASIPIAIGKAIISIPAQLLRFRVIQDKLHKEKENAELELLKAKKERADFDNKTLTDEIARLREKMKPAGAEVEPVPEPDVQDSKPRLGKAPASGPEQQKSLEEIIKKKSEVKARGVTNAEVEIQPGIISSHSWGQRFAGPWPEYDNKTINDCVPASAAHMMICWSSNTLPQAVQFDKNNVIDFFKNSDACQARGCNVSDFLRQWRRTGFCDTKIHSSARLRTSGENDLKLAIFYFGACMIGLQMPLMAQEQKDGKWFIDPNASAAARKRGSWAAQAGHAVCAIAYDERGVTVISWGQPVLMEWAFYKDYNDETYIALFDGWLSNNNKTPAPALKSREELEEIILTLNA